MIIKELIVFNSGKFNNLEYLSLGFSLRVDDNIYVMRIDVSQEVKYRNDGIHIDDKFLEERKRKILRENLLGAFPSRVEDYTCIYYINNNTIAADNDYLKGSGLYEDINYFEWVVKGLLE